MYFSKSLEKAPNERAVILNLNETFKSLTPNERIMYQRLGWQLLVHFKTNSFADNVILDTPVFMTKNFDICPDLTESMKMLRRCLEAMSKIRMYYARDNKYGMYATDAPIIIQWEVDLLYIRVYLNRNLKKSLEYIRDALYRLMLRMGC